MIHIDVKRLGRTVGGAGKRVTARRQHWPTTRPTRPEPGAGSSGGSSDVYTKYKDPFLTTVAGARSKELLVLDEDVQVLHGFDSVGHAEEYLASELFRADVVRELGPLLQADPDIRIFDVA